MMGLSLQEVIVRQLNRQKGTANDSANTQAAPQAQPAQAQAAPGAAVRLDGVRPAAGIGIALPGVAAPRIGINLPGVPAVGRPAVSESVQPGSDRIAPAQAGTTAGLGNPAPRSDSAKPALAGPAIALPVAALPGLKVRLPLAAAAGLGLRPDSDGAAPAGTPAAVGWDDLELGDFAPVSNQGSGAATPTYGLPQDHTPIPARDIPSTATPQQLEFISQLDSVYGVQHDAQLFSQVIRNLMIDMKDDPAMEVFISDSDIRVMVRGMREALGVARQQKQARAKAPSATSRKKGVKADAAWDEAMGDLIG